LREPAPRFRESAVGAHRPRVGLECNQVQREDARQGQWRAQCDLGSVCLAARNGRMEARRTPGPCRAGELGSGRKLPRSASLLSLPRRAHRRNRGHGTWAPVLATGASGASGRSASDARLMPSPGYLPKKKVEVVYCYQDGTYAHTRTGGLVTALADRASSLHPRRHAHGSRRAGGRQRLRTLRRLRVPPRSEGADCISRRARPGRERQT